MIENLGVGIDISNISNFKKMPFATTSGFYKEIFHLKSKPMIKLLDFKNKYNFRASISHENDYAIAIVISELIN